MRFELSTVFFLKTFFGVANAAQFFSFSEVVLGFIAFYFSDLTKNGIWDGSNSGLLA